MYYQANLNNNKENKKLKNITINILKEAVGNAFKLFNSYSLDKALIPK